MQGLRASSSCLDGLGRLYGLFVKSRLCFKRSRVRSYGFKGPNKGVPGVRIVSLKVPIFASR